MPQPSNFSFLSEYSPLLADLGATAERIFPFDPSSCVVKLRLLSASLAQEIAARIGVPQQQTQVDLLRTIDSRFNLDPQIRQLFHLLRKTGNIAAHEVGTRIGYREGLEALKVAREIAIWFHRTFGKAAEFNPGPFVLPDDPSHKLMALQQQITALNFELSAAQSARERQEQMAQLLKQQAEQEHLLAQRAQEERSAYQQLAEEASRRYTELKTRFDQELVEASKTIASSELPQFARRAADAARKVQLDEAATRQIIDQQLRDAGWEANTTDLIYAQGARPAKNKNRAIAEWPTTGGQAADYVLFAGLTPMAVVEAKRANANVAGKIPQAERYSRGFRLEGEHQPAWQLAGQSGPWPDGQDGHFHVPFVYSSNGRDYIQQLAEHSGTWFRDARMPSNLARPLMDFHSPEGLLDQLKRSKAAAETKLKEEGFDYLKLRDYQQKAIQAVEAALAENRPNCLLAMATGTGKTRTTIGLMYRFLKAERFRRILFLVDRTTLGQQAIDAFNEAPLEQNQPLSTIYNVAELGDMAAEAETRIQVATVQAMVKRIFQSDSPLAVDEFDCIIVDEAHRGYTLDQEMTEGELAVRDQAQYLSSYRRVLDYFDTVKIGLTATPAKHTSEIFGKPVYTYSYREAVADDWLIDHEPPIRYQTLLSQNGITFAKGEQVEAINTATGEIESAELDDEMIFNVESFNKRVINEDFNRVVCQQLAQELDPFGEEKTMIFCATDLHADMVKRLLDAEFKELYGDDYNEAAVRKITGQSDKVEQLIKRYKNERYPNIAITVDLLTTGIDVPKICHLVFMRRIRSRILYEQMIGRATRRCDDIGKTVFKIYDPVDIYAVLENVNTMKPLVKDPNITLEQLVDELTNPASFDTPGSQPEQSHAHDVLDALSQKVMRVLRNATHKAGKKPELKQRLNELEQLWGVAPEQLHQHLHQLGPNAATDFVRQHHQLLRQLAEVKQLLGREYMPLLSQHKDELVAREQNYGAYAKPADYLDSFGQFIREQLNQSTALAVVVNRPKDLTREQLKVVRLLLDEHGYSEARLQAAWRNQTNQEIAASIVGYIRQAALGEALLPFELRVTYAMQRIYALTSWTTIQRQWLERLAKQLVHEVVVDQDFINRAFAPHGGVKRLDTLLGGQLTPVLQQLADTLWTSAA